MADRVLLHLATPGSGAGTLRQLLTSAGPRLARAGVSLPGWSPEATDLACQDLLGVEFGAWPDPTAIGAWGRLVALVRRTRGTAVISSTLLAGPDDDAAARVVTDLAPAPVHVLLTPSEQVAPQDAGAVLRPWTDHVPPERVHVVVLPGGAPPDELWQRLGPVLGLPVVPPRRRPDR